MSFGEEYKLMWYEKLFWWLHRKLHNPYKRIILPEIRAEYPKLIAKDIVNVQPMTEETWDSALKAMALARLMNENREREEKESENDKMSE